VDHSDKDLKELVRTGVARGYLTYDEVNAYLPDEAVSPEKLEETFLNSGGLFLWITV